MILLGIFVWSMFTGHPGIMLLLVIRWFISGEEIKLWTAQQEGYERGVKEGKRLKKKLSA